MEDNSTFIFLAVVGFMAIIAYLILHRKDKVHSIQKIIAAVLLGIAGAFLLVIAIIIYGLYDLGNRFGT